MTDELMEKLHALERSIKGNFPLDRDVLVASDGFAGDDLEKAIDIVDAAI